MKKQFVPLAIALASLLAFAAVAAFNSGAPDRPETTHAVSAADPADFEAQASAPLADFPAKADSAPAQQEAQPATRAPVKTGCGKPVPCPGRSCEDCPNNIYLR